MRTRMSNRLQVTVDFQALIPFGKGSTSSEMHSLLAHAQPQWDPIRSLRKSLVKIIEKYLIQGFQRNISLEYTSEAQRSS